eukprot:1158395-Pelagomonas_calceolata.AAC.3
MENAIILARLRHAPYVQKLCPSVTVSLFGMTHGDTSFLLAPVRWLRQFVHEFAQLRTALAALSSQPAVGELLQLDWSRFPKWKQTAASRIADRSTVSRLGFAGNGLHLIDTRPCYQQCYSPGKSSVHG